MSRGLALVPLLDTYFDFFFWLRPIHLAFYISVKQGLLKYNADRYS